MARQRFDTAPQFNVAEDSVLIQQVAGSTTPMLELKNSAGSSVLTVSNAGVMTTSVTPSFTDISISGNATVTGNLTVNGNTITLNSEIVNIKDKNIVLGNIVGASNTTADGAGITIDAGGGIAKTFNFVNLTSSWTSSENINIPTGKTYKINNTDIITSTTLGSSVVNSSLTTLGNLSSLTVVGNTSANTVDATTYKKSGNEIIGLRYADITGVAVTNTEQDFLLNLPGGIDYLNFVSITPISNFDNNIVWIKGWALGNWSGVQTTTQVRIRAVLGNGVHLGTSTFRVYYRG